MSCSFSSGVRVDGEAGPEGAAAGERGPATSLHCRVLVNVSTAWPPLLFNDTGTFKLMAFLVIYATTK